MKKYVYFILLPVTLLSFLVNTAYVSANEFNGNPDSSNSELANSSTATLSSSSKLSSDSNHSNELSADSKERSKVSSDNNTTASEDSNTTVKENDGTSSIPSTITNELGTFTMPSNRSDIDRINDRQTQLLRSIPADGKNLPSKSFVDVSSNNGQLSVANFQKMKSYGVRGVIVKLTEGTTYTNPYASSQIANARSAGLKVSAYHFARYSNTNSAIAEANYFVQTAKNWFYNILCWWKIKVDFLPALFSYLQIKKRLTFGKI